MNRSLYYSAWVAFGCLLGWLIVLGLVAISRMLA